VVVILFVWLRESDNHHLVPFWKRKQITKCLDLDEGFAKSYEVYQDILKAIRTGDTDTMNQILLNYHPLNTAMDQTMTSLRKYRKQVLNALKLK